MWAFKQDQITVGMCGGMGKLVETASMRIPFKPQIQHLVCFVQLELRKDPLPSSILHKGSQNTNPVNTTICYNTMYTLTFSVFSTCSTIHLTDHFGSGILLRVSTLTQWSWNAATSLLPAQLLLCPICLHLLLYTVLLILWNNLCHMLEIT